MKYLLSALLFISGLAQADYVQLSSAVNHKDTIIYAEQLDGLDGMAIGQLGEVIVLNDGLYLIILAPQTSERAGCIDAWVMINDEDVENSNVRHCQTAGNTGVVISQSVMMLKAGDYINFVVFGSLSTEASQPMNEPLIPSVIITVVKL